MTASAMKDYIIRLISILGSSKVGWADAFDNKDITIKQVH